MTAIIYHQIVFWQIFVIFLLCQSYVHGKDWKNGEWISLEKKNIWAAIRGIVYGANALMYIFLFRNGEGWEIVSESLRLWFLQLLLFWLFYDIVLPWIAGKPQLWNDPTTTDNNSPYDRIGGNWIGNMAVKVISILLLIVWFWITDPNELFPFLPNWLVIGAVSVVIVGTIFVGLFQELFNTKSSKL